MEKACRPQRQRRHSRRAWPPEDDAHQLRPAKRLFTLDIKRMLKDWLIRRRDNPYPSRDEKKRLAVETGLTYTQICNWFANWRRKLKNSERERDCQKSWGHLIKNYNSNARGNVEQFSISSEDSIWGEHEGREMDYKSNDDDESQEALTRSMETYYSASYDQYYTSLINQQYQSCNREPSNGGNTSTADTNTNTIDSISFDSASHTSKTKYKQKIMEKYMREEQAGTHQLMDAANTETKELSKWLESAANFTPNKNNYYIEWTNNKRHKFPPMDKSSMQQEMSDMSPLSNQASSISSLDNAIMHHKDELDAAEALANLAFNCRQRMLDTAAHLQAVSY